MQQTNYNLNDNIYSQIYRNKAKTPQQYQKMSDIIDMEQQRAEMQRSEPNNMINMLKSVLRNYPFFCKNITHEGKKIVFHVKASPPTYRLSTIWEFNFVGDPFSLDICFYNSEQSQLLRASTIRMRIQLALLTQIANTQSNYAKFIVDTQSGILWLSSKNTWGQGGMLPEKGHIQNFIHHYFAILRKFDDLMVFIQPAEFDRKEISDKDKNAHTKINRFRTLMKNTRNVKKQIKACLKDLIRMRAMGDEGQMQQVKQLYMKNIVSFQKSMYGLEEANPFQCKFQDYQEEMKQIKKNEKGLSHQSVLDSNKNKKILLGLKKIEPYMQSQQQIFNKQGAHSQIYRKKFRYVVSQTIYKGTMNFQPSQFKQRAVEMRGELTYKKCKLTSQSSINSFRNELEVLKYLKEKYSPFVAKYYMLIKDSWDQNDTIYMCNYRQNIHSLLQSCTAYGIKQRLQLSYSIAKGLCFLYSNQIVHRDFKPQNIVIDGNMQPKIIDFGSASSHCGTNKFTPFDERLLTTQGYNIQYFVIPPGNEHLRQKYEKRQFDEHPLFDVYGFGRTLSYIFFNTLEPPHSQSFLSQPLFDILDHLIFLINMCTNVDPEDRPGFGELTSFLGVLKELVKNVNGQYMVNGVVRGSQQGS